MKSRLLCSALLLAAAGMAAPSFADTKTDAAKTDTKTDKKTTETATPTAQEQAMMQEWMKLSAPGESHKILATMAGDWDMEVKSWMAPTATPKVTKGKSDAKMIMGGRFLTEEVKGEMMGMPFEGQSLCAYDNMKKKFISTWIDNMGTTIMFMEGTFDPATKTMTMTSTTYDPMAKKDVPVRTVTRILDDNKHVFEWYSPGPDGKEFKGMEITYTRKAS